jgi:type I restriction enzyme S subunit
MKGKFKETEIGRIPEDWEVGNLGINIEKIFVGRDPEGGKQSHFKGITTFRIIQSAPVFDGYLDKEKVGYVTKEMYTSLESASLKEEDVLLNQLGDGITFARSCVVPNEILPAVITRSVGCIRCNKNKLNPWFLNAFLILPKTKQYIESFNSGSSRRAIDGGKMRSFLIPMPPLQEQRKIGFFYKAIQDKIELNQQMNKTLEAIGQALFKRWFVDFDFPDDEGKPYKSSGGEMVDSELGEIPKGWEVKKVGNVVDVKGGSTPSTKNREYWNGVIAWCTPKDLSVLSSSVLLGTERRITSAGLSHISSGLLPIGTLLLSSRAPIGYTVISEIPVAINQGFIAILCTKSVSNFFMLFWVKKNHDRIVSMANGSTFLEINKSSFKSMDILIPPQSILNTFDNVVGSAYVQTARNEKETRNIIQIRDSLLPKLMSGEIRVST